MSGHELCDFQADHPVKGMSGKYYRASSYRFSRLPAIDFFERMSLSLAELDRLFELGRLADRDSWQAACDWLIETEDPEAGWRLWIRPPDERVMLGVLWALIGYRHWGCLEPSTSRLPIPACPLPLLYC